MSETIPEIEIRDSTFSSGASHLCYSFETNFFLELVRSASSRKSDNFP